MQKITIELEDKLVNQAKADGIERLVAGAIIGRHREGKLEVLVLKRAVGDFMGEIEELPSGKLESNETLLQALRREVLEETSLEVSRVLSFVFSFDYLSSGKKATRQFNFVVQTKEGTVHVCSEHSSYRWLTRQSMERSKLTDNVKQAILQNWKRVARVFE